MNIGDKIKNAREENNLTQTQASESLMVSILSGIMILVLCRIYEDNPVIQFLNGAIPWIFLGLTFLFWIMSLHKLSKV